MKDYARIGDLTLQAISGVTTLSEGSGYDYAEHSLVSGKKVLQAIGPTLREVSLTVELNGYIHDDIIAKIDKLIAMRDSGKEQRLLFGDGTYTGSFVVTALNSKVAKTYADGSLYNVTIDLTLKEAVKREGVRVVHVEREPRPAKKTRRDPPGAVLPSPVGEEDPRYKPFF